MNVQVALLSAVNVGGRKVAMAPLKAACLQEDWPRVETLLASGNVLIDSGKMASRRVKTRVEAIVREHFGVETCAVMRTRAELDGVIAQNPFKSFQPNSLLVTFLDEAPMPDAAAQLHARYGDKEDFAIVGREIYARYESGVADSALTAPVIRRVLGTFGTARNWNTIKKLRDRLQDMEQ